MDAGLKKLLDDLTFCRSEEESSRVLGQYCSETGPLGMNFEFPASSCDQLKHLAMNHYRCQEWPEARKYLQILVNFQPDSSYNWKLLGAVLLQESKFQEALRALACALLSDPDDAECYFFSADCYIKLGQIEEAKKSLKMVLRLDSHSDQAQQMLNLLNTIEIP